ncbi:MAG: hypothetical protein JWN48_5727 [Myxococcaceae bacterium]|nr:hypothetical protein [Myxococcaceae bacterium]
MPLILHAGLSVLLALGLVRLLYTTHFGVGVLNSIPEELFRSFEGLWIEASERFVEDAQDLDALLVFLLCLLTSAIVLYGARRMRDCLFTPRR